MENEPRENSDKKPVAKATEDLEAEATSPTEGKIEETAKALSSQESKSSEDQSAARSESGEGKVKDSEKEDNDPGNVARMTAKGALSGF